MTTKSVSKKITVTYYTGSEKKLDAAIYVPFKSAIIQSLRKSKGKTYTEITDDVVQIIRKKIRAFKGSVPWYTVSVLHDLQARGIVESFVEKGKKLNRLKI